VTTHELVHNVAGDVVGIKPKRCEQLSEQRCERHDVVEPCAYCNEIPENESRSVDFDEQVQHLTQEGP
jgi:hypothetical protein